MPSVEQAYQHCRQVTRARAKNFYYAFITLPRPKRCAIYAAYAFCRLCDDVADEPMPPAEKLRRLEEVRRGLSATYQGDPQGPVFTALAHAAGVYSIPQEYLHAVVDGVEMDLTRSRYQTFDELRLYCYRVASAVGLICTEVFGYSDPAAREHAIDLGLAMQLTNILRDIKEDVSLGRIYLPQEDLEHFGYTEGEVEAGVQNDRFRALMQFEASRAREHFQRGKRLIPLLPLRSRACPAVLGGIYSRLLDRIEARGYNVFRERISLSSREKLLLALRLWCLSLLPLRGVATAW